jgi:hypothetical protein
MQVVFKTEPIAIRDGALILGIGVAVLIAVEMEKRLVGVVSSPRPA